MSLSLPLRNTLQNVQQYLKKNGVNTSCAIWGIITVGFASLDRDTKFAELEKRTHTARNFTVTTRAKLGFRDCLYLYL